MEVKNKIKKKTSTHKLMIFNRIILKYKMIVQKMKMNNYNNFNKNNRNSSK